MVGEFSLGKARLISRLTIEKKKSGCEVFPLSFFKLLGDLTALPCLSLFTSGVSVSGGAWARCIKGRFITKIAWSSDTHFPLLLTVPHGHEAKTTNVPPFWSSGQNINAFVHHHCCSDPQTKGQKSHFETSLSTIWQNVNKTVDLAFKSIIVFFPPALRTW